MEKNTQYNLNKGLAQMLKGGVIMDGHLQNRQKSPKPQVPVQ